MSDLQNQIIYAPMTMPMSMHIGDKSETQQILQIVQDIKKEQSDEADSSNALVLILLYIYFIYLIYVGLGYLIGYLYAEDPVEVSPYIASAPTMSTRGSVAPPYQQMAQVSRASL